MQRRLDDLTLIFVATGVALFTIVVLPQSPLRPVLTLSLILMLPGYALTIALFPDGGLGVPLRLLLSVGLSVAITMLGGLLLNLLPWGLQANTWTGLLISIILVASTIAWWRRRSYRVGVQTLRSFNPQFRTEHILILSLSGLIALSAIGIARTPASQANLQGYTTLWIVPMDEQAQETVRLGVSNNEFAAMRYRLQLVAYGQIIHEWPLIDLDPGETWEQMASVQLQALGAEPVKALLYRLDQPTQVYREGIWWPNKAQ